MKKRIKTWHYWHEFFFQLYKEVDAMLPKYHGGSFSVWNYLDTTARKSLADKCYFQANAACLHYIENNRWDDNLSVDVLCVVLGRIKTATDFCLDLNIWQGSKSNIVVRPPDPSITPHDEILSFFLLAMHKSIYLEIHSKETS